MHGKDYAAVQRRFLRAVNSLDPNQINAVLAAHPYHIDSLLQMSEILKVQGDVQTAADLGAAVVLEAHIEVYERVRKVTRAATSNDGFYISR